MNHAKDVIRYQRKAGENVLRLTPPLTITAAEADHGLALLEEVLS